MTHADLVKEARKCGLEQCKWYLWMDIDGYAIHASDESVKYITKCCEVGVLWWGVYSNYITIKEKDTFILSIGNELKKRGHSQDISEANDKIGYTWDNFSEMADAKEQS